MRLLPPWPRYLSPWWWRWQAVLNIISVSTKLRRAIPEDSHIHTRRVNNLNYHLIGVLKYLATGIIKRHVTLKFLQAINTNKGLKQRQSFPSSYLCRPYFSRRTCLLEYSINNLVKSFSSVVWCRELGLTVCFVLYRHPHFLSLYLLCLTISKTYF
jgi:hypothetical protein